MISYRPFSHVRLAKSLQDVLDGHTWDVCPVDYLCLWKKCRIPKIGSNQITLHYLLHCHPQTPLRNKNKAVIQVPLYRSEQNINSSA